jgi:REP element-mobilizing transposase RayT
MKPAPSNEPNPGLERVRYQLRSSGVRPETPNPLRSGVHSRGFLPHVKREGAAYFVTFRLADSLPTEVLRGFEAHKAERLRRLSQLPQGSQPGDDSEDETNREFRRQVERYLDQGHGACHLRRPDVAELVASALQYFDGERYLLDDWVVMPNHVHAVLWPMPNPLLGEILKSWKQYTSRRARLLVGLGGERFWQVESYDHWIRSDDEQARICRYIRSNPVTARLCAQPEDWRWSSAWPGWKSAGEAPTL